MADVPTPTAAPARACAAHGHRPSAGPARCPAAGRPDLDHGRRRGRDAARSCWWSVDRRRRPAASRDCRTARSRAPIACATTRTGCGCWRPRHYATHRPQKRRRRGAAAPNDPAPAPVQDPIAEERRRREYESLFASNVVLSRRPDSERPDQGRPPTTQAPASRADRLGQSVVEKSLTRWCEPRPGHGRERLGCGPAIASCRRTSTKSHARSDPAQRRTPTYTTADQRRRAAVSRPRRNDHRYGSDQSTGRRQRGAGELPGHERALLAHGPTGAHSRRRPDPGRDEARADVRARRASPCPSIAC